MQADTATKRLETLPELALTGKQVNGLFRLLTHRPIWTEGLERIKRNKGAGTPGVDGTKVSDLGEAEIEAAIQKLMDGTYQPKPVRRVYIPKSNGKLRPLGIPSAMDRLVQEVVRSILNRIYEPVFSKHSHGFRERRSCHTAIDHVLRTWTAAKWFVEVDIEGYFDNIDHSVLLRLLSKRIEDRKFLNLIRSMLKAGFLEDWKFNKTYSGTPQGGIISPLLANIYLHELDQYMEERIEGFNKGKVRKVHPEYKRMNNKLVRLKRKIADLRAKGLEDEAKQVEIQWAKDREYTMSLSSVDPMDPDFKRLRYVRYADDFLIGVIGSKEEARAIMNDVKTFLHDNLKLEISAEKSGIQKASKGVQFLGYNVQVYTGKGRVVTMNTRWRRITKRTMTDKIQVSVPIEKVLGFAKKHGYGHLFENVSMHRAKLLHCNDTEIVRVYNAELRGFANYYALAYDVKLKLSKLAWLWSSSLFKTLAGKHQTSVMKLSSQTRVAPGHYTVRQNVKGKTVEVSLWRLADLKRKQVSYWDVDNILDENYLIATSTNMNDRLTAEQCHYCKTTEGPFDVHHLNPMRTAKKSGHVRMQSARSRKTIPVCDDCHVLLHSGKLPDMRVGKKGAESRVQ